MNKVIVGLLFWPLQGSAVPTWGQEDNVVNLPLTWHGGQGWWGLARDNRCKRLQAGGQGTRAGAKVGAVLAHRMGLSPASGSHVEIQAQHCQAFQ